MKYKTWVDRVENETVILDFEGRIIRIPRNMLLEAKEGDCILLSLEKSIVEQQNRENEIKDIMDNLWEK